MLAVKQPSSGSAYGFKIRGKSSTSKIDAVASDFEAQFVSQMMGSMFNTIDRDEETGGGDAEDVYQSLLVNEYGKIVAKTGGVGVADYVRNFMIQQQGVK